MRNEDDVRALVDKTVARFGRLDVAVNNAGTEGQVGPITDQTAETYAETSNTNVLGVILSIKQEVRAMQAQGSGSIINISSTYGHEGAAGASIYVGSKHAVEGISKSVALELASSGIRVNVVAPGTTDTDMLTRFTGTPQSKAELVANVPMQRLGLPGGDRQRDRLHRIRRSLIHHRPRPQRRRRPHGQLTRPGVGGRSGRPALVFWNHGPDRRVIHALDGARRCGGCLRSGGR